MTNTLRIMLEILNNYPWTRLTVRIIRAIKRHFFHMVTHVFDNGNLSQELYKYVLSDMVTGTCLRSFRLFGDQASVRTKGKSIS